jgi:hypothetical protein
LFLLVSGCLFLPFDYVHWDIELTKIEQSSQAKASHGVLRQTSKGHFEDDLVKIEAETKDPMEAIFILTNKTQHDIRIDWRRAKFVDIYSRTHPVDVTPLGGLWLLNLTEGHTQEDGTFTELRGAQSVRIRFTPPGKPYIRRVWGWEIPVLTGRTVEVSFPLQVQGKSYEYISTFQVTKIGYSK